MTKAEQAPTVITRFRNLSLEEATRIVDAHRDDPNVAIQSVRIRVNGDISTSTRVPYLDQKHGLKDGLTNLRREMVLADEVRLMTKPKRA